MSPAPKFFPGKRTGEGDFFNQTVNLMRKANSFAKVRT